MSNGHFAWVHLLSWAEPAANGTQRQGGSGAFSALGKQYSAEDRAWLLGADRSVLEFWLGNDLAVCPWKIATENGVMISNSQDCEEPSRSCILVPTTVSGQSNISVGATRGGKPPLSLPVSQMKPRPGTFCYCPGVSPKTWVCDLTLGS